MSRNPAQSQNPKYRKRLLHEDINYKIIYNNEHL